jgi:flagellar protein FlaG
MSTLSMNATGAARALRLAEPSLRMAVNRPGANRAYSQRGVKIISQRRLSEKRAERALEKAQDSAAELLAANRRIESGKALAAADAESRRAAGEAGLRDALAAARFKNRRTPLSESMLRNALGKMDEYVRAIYHHLEYDYHERSGEYFVKVIDDETDKVIREIPPEKLLDIYSSLMEMVGLFYDERR